MGWVVNATSLPFYPREGTGANCIERWVGPGPVWTGANCIERWVGPGAENLPPGIDPQTLQPVTNRYTD
jgi:hypothetical protein